MFNRRNKSPVGRVMVLLIVPLLVVLVWPLTIQLLLAALRFCWKCAHGKAGLMMA